MSELMQGKYEVLKIIRANVLAGLESFQLEGWKCLEANQPSIKNLDKVVTLEFKKMNRVGWQAIKYFKDEDNAKKLKRREDWIEEQEWEVKVLLKRINQEVTAETITVDDVTYMLAGWFNGMGVEFFRKNGCGNLYVQMKDVKIYNDQSNLSQISGSFPLKLHVPKVKIYGYDSANAKNELLMGIK